MHVLINYYRKLLEQIDIAMNIFKTMVFDIIERLDMLIGFQWEMV
jgi:hypothetical protein